MKINKSAKKIALARIEASSDKLRINIVGKGWFDKAKMIENIKKETEVGKKLVDIQIEFLKDMASGKFYG